MQAPPEPFRLVDHGARFGRRRAQRLFDKDIDALAHGGHRRLIMVGIRRNDMHRIQLQLRQHCAPIAESMGHAITLGKGRRFFLIDIDNGPHFHCRRVGQHIQVARAKIANADYRAA